MPQKRPDVPTGQIIDPETGKLTIDGQQWAAEIVRLLKALLDDAGI